MIGVTGQYIYKFSIGSFVDFIHEGDIHSFRIVEEAGNILPTFELIFQVGTNQENVLKSINEGNKLKVSYGVNASKLVDTTLTITKHQSGRTGENARRIKCVGLLDKLSYVTDNKIKIYEDDKKDGITVINKVASNHFNVINDCPSSLGKQYWIQPNTTDKKFVNELWMHSYRPNSFPIIAITLDKQFLLQDARLAMAKSPKWTFTYKKNSDTDIIIEGDYTYTSDTGFMNTILGYGREKLINKLIEGDFDKLEEDAISTIMAMGNMDRDSSVKKRPDLIMPYDKYNANDNYWKAFLLNKINLAVFSSHKVTLHYLDQFKTVRLLDPVMMKEDVITGDKRTDQEQLSGKWMITKIARSIGAKEHLTVIELSRESLNSMIGSLR